MNPKIITWPNPNLREECSECLLGVEDRNTIGNMMISIMFANDGVGLAAIQIDLLLRIFVMRNPREQTKGLIFVNPNITYLSPNTISDWESCLSIPRYGHHKPKVKIERASKVEFSFDEPEDPNKRASQVFEGLDARIVQHEVDHLNGVMIFDYIKGELPRKLFMEKYMKARRNCDRIK